MAVAAHHPHPHLHLHLHLPAPMSRAAHGLERVLCATFFTLLPPVGFALLILGGLLIAMGVARLL